MKFLFDGTIKLEGIFVIGNDMPRNPVKIVDFLKN
jgi:hypothetical protein